MAVHLDVFDDALWRDLLHGRGVLDAGSMVSIDAYLTERRVLREMSDDRRRLQRELDEARMPLRPVGRVDFPDGDYPDRPNEAE